MAISVLTEDDWRRPIILKIRPTEKAASDWPVCVRLRHVLKKLLRVYFFRCEAIHYADEPDPLANLPRPLPPPGNPRPLVRRPDGN